jgi:hypothetical protein
LGGEGADTMNQHDHLSKLRQVAYERQPDMKLLRKILLNIGGEEVVFYFPEPFLVTLLEFGEKFFRGDARLVVGRDNLCHNNSKYLSMKYNTYKLYHGYALSDDGLWRQHSWCLTKTGNVIETTDIREIYYGTWRSPCLERCPL